jgi:NAD(P)-dependent dehydrogenase (short-subunit alcohol dehydrogenase family)
MTTMNDRVCLITGATSGIGKETALALAHMGAAVVIVGRDAARGAATAEAIRRETGNPAVEALTADLSLMADVRRLADEFRTRYTQLDVLINNAGAIFMTREQTAEGLERTFALNHMSYFLLTNLLLDMIRASAPARIINVSSGAHLQGSFDARNLQGERGYSGFGAYSRSKLLNIMFTYELARRLDGTGVTANALHPGLVRTGFGHNNGRLLSEAFRVFQRFGIDARQGAETPIFLASSPEVEGITGQYFVRKKAVRSSARSYDRAAQSTLWEISERIAALQPETA